MHGFARTHTIPLRALIDNDLVNIIIGDMMFHPEDMVRINRSRLLASFVPTLDSSEDAEDTGNVSWYDITVGNTKHFQLVAQYLAAGMSFHQVAQVMLNTKELLSIRSIGS